MIRIPSMLHRYPHFDVPVNCFMLSLAPSKFVEWFVPVSHMYNITGILPIFLATSNLVRAPLAFRNHVPAGSARRQLRRCGRARYCWSTQ